MTLYKEEDLQKLRNNPHDACVAAWEEGTENKNKHLQVYIKFPSNKRGPWLKALLDESAHFEPAEGAEWQCRRYIVDVEGYLRDNPNAHFKTQGDVIHDYGCEAIVDRSDPNDVKVNKMIADGAPLYQVYRENPLYYYHNYAKVNNLFDKVSSWRAEGYEYKPSEFGSYKKPPRAKKARTD